MKVNQPQSLAEIQTLLGDLPRANVPVALLPVRLETRFTNEADKIYLCVRIFPDDLHIDTHEPELTEDEVRWGKHLWEQVWRSGRDTALEQALQAELAQRFGPGRAAWIAQTLSPLNPQDRSDRPGDLPIEPEFPEVPMRAAPWTVAPQARALPDRWILCGYRNGERVLAVASEPIPGTLAAGPSPVEPDPSTEAGQELLAQREDNTILPIDADMKWMVDFEAAVNQGMGLRIELPSVQEAQAGYDRLVVLGLAGDSPEAAAATLEALLASQRYTDSLAFVPQGSPSNNTAESAASYTAAEPEQTTALLSQIPADPSEPDCNGPTTARALGIGPASFAQLPHTRDREQADAQAMNTALWPATWGYFFRYILGHANGHLTDETIESLRTYFRNFVRARGPIPVLRMGNQPYGILPVTSLDRYQPDGTNSQEGFTGRGLEILKKLRDHWRQSIGPIPRVEPKATTEEMDQTLADILGMQAVSNDLLGRMAFDGILYGVPEPGPAGLPTDEDHDAFHHHEGAMLQLNALDEALNLPDHSVPGASLVFTEPLYRIPPTGLEHGITRDFLQRLKSAPFASLNGHLLNEEERQIPLILMLRHSVLLAYLDTAYNLHREQGFLQPEDHREPSLVGILTDPQTNVVENTPTLLQLLDRPVSDFALDVPDAGSQTLGEVIHTLRADHHPSAQVLADTRESLDHLATLPPEQLDGLLRETLDLASHRLDAWITSLATVRLEHFRQQQPQGLVLGGYGWVENLRLNTNGNGGSTFGDREIVQPAPPGEEIPGQPLYTSPRNSGYVTAPSLPQATTAAILRSGYLNHGSQNATDPFAIDLSSNRVRLAKWLLDGVRQGQSLGALLGYRFERGLREDRLAEYILPFRKVVPFGDIHRQNLGESEFILHYRETHLAPDSLDRDAIETIEAQHVVDGLELMRLWQEERLPFGTGPHDLNIKSSDRPRVHQHLDHLVETVDAVSDLVTAESLYQLVQGNELRLGGTLDAIAKGETPPPDPDIVRIPRTGVAHTHRIPITFSGEAVPVATWPLSPLQKRVDLEPHLNRWVADLLGDAEQVRIEATYWDPDADRAILPVGQRTLQDFALSPLDAIYLATVNETGTGSALEALMAYQIMRRRDPSVPATATVRFTYDRAADWSAEQISLGTFQELARAVRDLVANSRPLDARDLSTPEADATSNLDADQLNRRAQDLVDYFNTIRGQLEMAIAAVQGGDENLNALRVGILRFVYAGLNEAVPLNASDDQPSASSILLEQAQNILGAVDRRIEVLGTIERSIDRRTASDDQKIDIDTKRIQIILGKDFPVLPKFTPVNSDALLDTLSDSLSLQNQDPLAAITWLTQMSQVRDGCNRLHTCLSYAETLDPDFTVDCTVGQLPYAAGDRWVALPLDPAQPITTARTAWMALFPNSLRLDAPLSGLMIDEWVETIPNAQETAAATFHFDAPQSQTPHAILLAVPPDNQENWQLATLEVILQETLELARLRAVDNAALFANNAHGYFLPALYFAFNPDSDPNTRLPNAEDAIATVSTDFTPTAENISAPFPPRIISISPQFAFVGDVVDITIRGDNLAEAEDVRFFGFINVSNVEIISNAELRCRISLESSNLTPGLSIFDIDTPNGTAESHTSEVYFEVKERPSLTRITPSSSFNGDVVNRAVVEGKNLTGATAVNFLGSGLQVSDLRVLGDTRLSFILTISSSSSTIGQHQFEVVTPNGTVRSTFNFTVKGRPTLSGVSPRAFDPGAQNQALTIRGTRLTGATGIRFVKSGISGRIVQVSSTRLDCRINIDTNAPGTSRFEVLIPTGKNGKVQNPDLTIIVVPPPDPGPSPKPPRPGDPRPPTDPK